MSIYLLPDDTIRVTDPVLGTGIFDTRGNPIRVSPGLASCAWIVRTRLSSLGFAVDFKGI